MLATVAATTSGSAAWAQDEAQPGAVLAERLLSTDRAEREKVFQEVQHQHGELVNGLLKNFEALSQKPDRTYGSAFHWTVMLLGRLRVETAAGQILGSIDFRLDMLTAPPGGFGGPAAEYPVTQALKEIGGKSVSDSIFQMLAYRTDDKTLTLCAWVLSDVMGRDVTLMVAEKKLSELKARLLRIGVDGADNSQRQNLEKLLQLLAKEETVALAVHNLK